jgi:aryl-alcohol dehydrogenase-like predicted oxidoreductase
MTLQRHPLGSSSLEVSSVALGSWRTFERLPREQALAVMRHARECGIAFLDDARYDDESGTAPVRTGYSEIVFGELFRAAGYGRDDVVVSEKLWWEFWPEQSAAAELDDSLMRLGFDYVDLIYAIRLPQQLSVDQAVAEVARLLRAGKARAWGVAMWEAKDIEAATRAAAAEGIDPPCAAQMGYSIVSREHATTAPMLDALHTAHAGLVAASSLEGGLLTGKYSDKREAGRLGASARSPEYARALRAGEELRGLAHEWGTSAAALAVAFALDHPLIASVLLGATHPEQLDETIAGVTLRAQLSNSERAQLHDVGAT